MLISYLNCYFISEHGQMIKQNVVLSLQVHFLFKKKYQFKDISLWNRLYMQKKYSAKLQVVRHSTFGSWWILLIVTSDDASEQFGSWSIVDPNWVVRPQIDPDRDRWFRWKRARVFTKEKKKKGGKKKSQRALDDRKLATNGPRLKMYDKSVPC